MIGLGKTTLVLVALGFVLGGCGGATVVTSGEPAVVSSAGDGAAVPVLNLFEDPVPDHPDPARRAGAASNFIECEHGIWDGGWSEDFGPPGSGPDPEAALAAFLGDGLFAVPRAGFAFAGTDDSRRLFTYTNDGAPKVAIIVVDGTEVALDGADGWIVETFASCDPAELDPSVDEDLPFEIWTDVGGRRVPVGTVSSASGPSHCDWESVTFLRLYDTSYVRDPDGLLIDDAGIGPFEADVQLPADATDTGYRRDGRELWIAADRSTAYIVTADRVEAWPSPVHVFGCA